MIQCTDRIIVLYRAIHKSFAMKTIFSLFFAIFCSLIQANAQPKLEVIGGSTYDWGKVPFSKGPCLLYTSPSPRDLSTSRMPSSA